MKGPIGREVVAFQEHATASPAWGWCVAIFVFRVPDYREILFLGGVLRRYIALFQRIFVEMR
ncbi:hypothetical protein [Thalassospira sp. TSL5-1]|uniref:hypothetical protein n=1 Tax=Thalassospira sp. TSL5-1 TaxID=1544451 RepID=UPI0009FA08CB|nr:hypothetical protein [Thalassospira sp. TSL5-1]